MVLEIGRGYNENRILSFKKASQRPARSEGGERPIEKDCCRASKCPCGSVTHSQAYAGTLFCAAGEEKLSLMRLKVD